MPTDSSTVGPSAIAVEPRSEQVFIVPQDESVSDAALERLCYVLRYSARENMTRGTENVIIFKRGMCVGN